MSCWRLRSRAIVPPLSLKVSSDPQAGLHSIIFEPAVERYGNDHSLRSLFIFLHALTPKPWSLMWMEGISTLTMAVSRLILEDRCCWMSMREARHLFATAVVLHPLRLVEAQISLLCILFTSHHSSSRMKHLLSNKWLKSFPIPPSKWIMAWKIVSPPPCGVL